MMDSNHVTKSILRLTLEVIYLLTGEEYVPVKNCAEFVSFKSFMDPPLPSRRNEKIRELVHKMLHLLTGEVPVRCEDIMVCFSMEEWAYVEGHKALYEDVLTGGPAAAPALVGDTAEEAKTDLPGKSGNKEEGPATDEGWRSGENRCESPLYALDCAEEDCDVSQHSSDKYGSLPSTQEDGEDQEREDSDCVSQQDEENDASDYSGDDEALPNDCKLEAGDTSKDCQPETDDLAKDCKAEVDGLPKDCKQEMGGLPKDCKWEDVKKLKGCKYEDDGIEQYYEDLCPGHGEERKPAQDCKDFTEETKELLKEVKIEVVSDDDWEEETALWGEQGRDLFMEETAADLRPDVSHNRASAERHPRRLHPPGAPRDYQLCDPVVQRRLDSMNQRCSARSSGRAHRSFTALSFSEPEIYPSTEALKRGTQTPAVTADDLRVIGCNEGDDVHPPDCMSPILPGDKADKSNPQTKPNCPNNHEPETLTISSVKKCVRTFASCQRELMSHTGSPAAAQEFVQMGQQQKNINTARKTTSDIQTLQNFMSEMRENRRIEEMPHTELDTLLSKFILLVKRKDGNEYEPHTLRCMVGSIDRFLKEHRYNHTIIYGNSKDFPLTKQSLNAKIKFLKKIAESNPPIRQEALTDDDIENLFKTGTLSLDNPTSLLNFVFFNNGIHFALRTKEQYSLQWGDVKLKIDPRGNRYLEYSDRQTEMVENRKNVRQMKPRIYATPHAPDRDPVTAYVKYQSFRPGAMMTPDSPFYLAPNVNYNPAFSEWYRSTKIGIQKIRAMMTTMKIRASLPESKRKVSYITKRRLVDRLPQHTLAPSGAMVPAAQHNNKPAAMEMKQRKPAIIINNLHTALARPSQERLPTASTIQPHPSTSRYGELPVHKRSFLVPEFAQQRNTNIYLNNYPYLASEEPARKRKPTYDFKKE